MHFEIQKACLDSLKLNRFSTYAKRRAINDKKFNIYKSIDKEMHINHCDYVTLIGNMEEKWVNSMKFDTCSYS